MYFIRNCTSQEEIHVSSGDCGDNSVDHPLLPPYSLFTKKSHVWKRMYIIFKMLLFPILHEVHVLEVADM